MSIKDSISKFSHLEEEGTNLFGFELIEMNLPFEIMDDEDLCKLFNDKKLVPYAGTMEKTGDNLLEFYNDMADFTPTSSACIYTKKIVSFGGKLQIVKSSSSIFDFEEEYEEVSMDLKKKYAEFISSINFGIDQDLYNAQINQYEEFERNGNMWLEVEMYQVGKDKVINFRRWQTKHVRFLYTKNEERYVALSYKWDSDYLKKNPERYVPVYPYVENNKGVFRTVIHEKAAGNFWYGRPSSKGSILNQYSEYQNMYYLCRLTSKDFTGRLIIEIEDDAPNQNRLINNKRDQQAGFQSTLDRFEKRFTNRSKNPSTFILMTRPPNSKPMQVEQILPNTNERYYEKMDKINSGQIIRSHSWSPRLLGGDAVSLFSTGVYMDELKVKDATTNIYFQNKVHGLFDKAIKLAMSWADVNLQYITYKVTSPYVAILKNEKMINDKYGVKPVDDETNLI